MRPLPSLCALLLVAPLVAPAASYAQPRYTLTEFGTVAGGTATVAEGINDDGVVVGTLSVGGRRHAFIYEDGTVHDLGTFGQREAMAGKVNEFGQVTITTIVVVVGVGRSGPGFLYDRRDGSARRLPTLGGSFGYGTDINRAGQMAGISHPGGTGLRERAVRYDDHGRVITDLGTLGGTRSLGRGINDAGDVVGDALNGRLEGNAQIYRAFLRRAAGWAMIDLGTLGGEFSVAFDVNNRGQVVGQAEFNPRSRWHAFLWEDGVMRDLGTLMANSYAQAVNESGDVVGHMCDNVQLNRHAFVYTGGVLYDLNALADLPAGWTLREAYDVNELGQIVGWGTDAAGRSAAFLLTPVPEPRAAGILGAGVMVLLRRRGNAEGRGRRMKAEG